MKPSMLVALATATTVSAHAIFQKVSVNGADQGQLKGVRAPSSNNPIQDVNNADLACNTGLTYRDSTVIKIPAGAKVGAWWQHQIGGPAGPNDPDNPIAASHKGPISVYLSKVDNAATATTSGLKWFKIAERGLNNGIWAVDEMISAGGWHYFDMPSCVAPGQYLMRVELLALHNAYSAGGAQFYMECAQIEVSGSGTNTGGSALVSLPGAYPANDPGIVLNIYDTSGNPTNGGRVYPVPGPDPITCGASNPTSTSSTKASTTSTSTKATTTSTTLVTSTKTSASATSTAASGGGGTAALYAQCGGLGYTGPTTCAQGTCKYSNDWYSQCL